MTTDTVIPAKAGIQYAHSGMRALLEDTCLRRQVIAAAGLHFADWVLDCRLSGNDDGGHIARCFHYPLFSLPAVFAGECVTSVTLKEPALQ